MKKIIFLSFSIFLFYNYLNAFSVGEKIFKERCYSCHGESAELNAFGHSRKIAGWHPRRIERILNDYKRGTYGGRMADVMQEQVADLSPYEMRSLAEYISYLGR